MQFPIIEVVTLCVVAALLLTIASLQAQPAAINPNGGFEEGTIAALPGWKRQPWAKGVALDHQVAHSGKRSLRVFAPGGMRTRLLPYPGGRVHAEGWMKTEGIVRGAAAPWHMAALQIISYDADRKPVGHNDIALVEGTHNWAHFETTAVLSRDIAYISVDCHLWGEDVVGTAWYDDVAIQMLDAGGRPRRPLDLSRATVTADFGKPLGKFRHLWVGSDVGWSDRVLTQTQINAMRRASRIGFRYIRMHDCVHNPKIYSANADGNLVYDWTGLDRRLETALGCGFWPVVVLEGMPPEIAAADAGLGWMNPYPPKGPAEYLKWQALVRAIVSHCRNRWGDDIHNWYFEVWNEPDASGYFKGTLAEYLRIYDHAVAGATAADPGVRIGGPGGAGTGWVRAFLQHCADGHNDATGHTGCRVDFLSWHIYSVGVGVPSFDALSGSLADTRRVLDEFPRYRELPTLITEWGCSSSSHPTHDRPYDAAFRTMAVREFMDAGITLALPFCMADGPQHCHDGFGGNLGLFTKTTIPKPSFRAFELLSRMVGQRVSCKSSNDPLGSLACVSEDRRRAWVMLYNLIESYTKEPYETRVELRLPGLPQGNWRAQTTAIAPGGCDPFLVWKKMDRPKTLTPAQKDELLAASELPAPVPTQIEGGTITLDMPGFSVLLVELER